MIGGDEIGKLNDLTKTNSPNLTWSLVDWTSRGDVIVVEWESTNRYGERVLSWRGVDKLTLKDGKIIEEIVYADTGPLQAVRRGDDVRALRPVEHLADAREPAVRARQQVRARVGRRAHARLRRQDVGSLMQ